MQGARPEAVAPGLEAQLPALGKLPLGQAVPEELGHAAVVEVAVVDLLAGFRVVDEGRPDERMVGEHAEVGGHHAAHVVAEGRAVVDSPQVPVDEGAQLGIRVVLVEDRHHEGHVDLAAAGEGELLVARVLVPGRGGELAEHADEEGPVPELELAAREGGPGSAGSRDRIDEEGPLTWRQGGGQLGPVLRRLVRVVVDLVPVENEEDPRDLGWIPEQPDPRVLEHAFRALEDGLHAVLEPYALPLEARGRGGEGRNEKQDEARDDHRYTHRFGSFHDGEYMPWRP